MISMVIKESSCWNNFGECGIMLLHFSKIKQKGDLRGLDTPLKEITLIEIFMLHIWKYF